MKKIVVFLILTTLLVMAAPVSARSKERVGERLNIFVSGSQTFPMEDPFHIAHGWILDPSEAPLGLFTFQLEVDGVIQGEDFTDIYAAHDTSPEFLYKIFVYNFPGGMTGEHIFTGHWFVPCQAVYDDCERLNELVETHTSTVYVTFVNP